MGPNFPVKNPLHNVKAHDNHNDFVCDARESTNPDYQVAPQVLELVVFKPAKTSSCNIGCRRFEQEYLMMFSVAFVDEGHGVQLGSVNKLPKRN